MIFYFGIWAIVNFCVAYYLNISGFKDLVDHTFKASASSEPIEAIEVVELSKTPNEIKKLEIEEAKKFAKEFSMEQFATFAEQIKSLKEIEMLLKDGNVSGVFEKYMSTGDWASFASEVYAYSAKHNISLSKSFTNTCVAKVFGVDIEDVGREFQNYSALINESFDILSGGVLKSVSMEGTSDSEILFKITRAIEPTDHNKAVLGAAQMIFEANSEKVKLDEDLFQASFKAFVDERIPELVQDFNAGLVSE